MELKILDQVLIFKDKIKSHTSLIPIVLKGVDGITVSCIRPTRIILYSHDLLGFLFGF